MGLHSVYYPNCWGHSINDSADETTGLVSYRFPTDELVSTWQPPEPSRLPSFSISETPKGDRPVGLHVRHRKVAQDCVFE
ncbi:hypothetical protein FOTG_15101 [Fusarium oxysporum f. sp. vasinfectum 25433]|uniref:Uncharacterized protein n=1 Tax=Fusarium oxysporum f. sp. vasinfectum 25433 TaxID=1089449 RepID=X0L6J1_FUSOX|nr:hypothetical protein FOTG_15101 [Fusarium oxysporum f. sp. vasinfectum 25433]